MGVELVSINTTNGSVKIITAEGVKDDQQTSLDAAMSKVAEYLDKKYEVISSSGGVYVLKKPQGVQPMHKGEFIKTGIIDDEPKF